MVGVFWTLVILLGPFAGLALLGWALLSIFSTELRHAMRRRWAISATLFMLLLLLAGPYAGLLIGARNIHQAHERRQAALNITLQQPMTIDGVSMPAGTRLTLEEENQLATYTFAKFPRPVAMESLQVLTVHRFWQTTYDDNFAVTGRAVKSMVLSGEGDQTIQGWQCDATQSVNLIKQSDFGVFTLEKCVLGQGHRVADIDIPAGSEVFAENGSRSKSGDEPPVRWRIHGHESEIISVVGLPLLKPRLYLDTERRLIKVDEAELACPTSFGGLHYPAGTHVKTLPSRPYQRKARISAYFGNLAFSPWRGQSASYPGHGDVPEGMSVVQTLNGKVLRIVKRELVGEFQFAEFCFHGKEPPQKPHCPSVKHLR